MPIVYQINITVVSCILCHTYGASKDCFILLKNRYMTQIWLWKYIFPTDKLLSWCLLCRHSEHLEKSAPAPVQFPPWTIVTMDNQIPPGQFLPGYLFHNKRKWPIVIILTFIQNETEINDSLGKWQLLIGMENLADILEPHTSLTELYNFQDIDLG